MRFSNLKIPAQDAADRAAELARNLKANKGVSDFRGYALGVVARRLARNPRDYLRYGPYWWALKELLIDSNRLAGSEFDSMVASEYRGETPEQTLALCEMFRDEMMATAIGGHMQSYRLTDDPEAEPYVLFDADMEAIPAP